MHTLRKALIAFAAVLLFGVAIAPRARADDWNQRVKLTFSQPVAIPGKALPAGTYWFQLLNSSSNRNVVEIFGHNDQRLYAVEMTAAAYRPASTSDVEVRFAERPHDQPEALLTWYFPGMLYGHQFIYSQHREKTLAKDMHQEILAAPNGGVLAPNAGQAVG